MCFVPPAGLPYGSLCRGFFEGPIIRGHAVLTFMPWSSNSLSS